MSDYEFKVGDRVLLPLKEEGIIRKIHTEIWKFFPYVVQITKPNKLFHNRNVREEYKKCQIKLKK